MPKTDVVFHQAHLVLITQGKGVMLVTGRVWRGIWPGIKRRSQLPGYVDRYLNGKIKIDPMITHNLPLDQINKHSS